MVVQHFSLKLKCHKDLNFLMNNRVETPQKIRFLKYLLEIGNEIKPGDIAIRQK